MPTGYTNKVSEGKEKTLKGYALECARAFFIECRDSNDKITLNKKADTKYYDEKIKKIKEELKSLNKMSNSVDFQFAADNEHKEYMKIIEQINKDRLEMKARYLAMLDKIQKWKVTSDLMNLKKFMIQQLQDSIEWDCSTDHINNNISLKKKTGKEWYNDKYKKLDNDLLYCEKERQKIIDATKKRNVFVKQLMESLK
jgi:hypothetical protein